MEDWGLPARVPLSEEGSRDVLGSEHLSAPGADAEEALGKAQPRPGRALALRRPGSASPWSPTWAEPRGSCSENLCSQEIPAVRSREPS